MAENILHLLGTAQPEGTGIAGIVGALARGLDPAEYKLYACFLNGDGPLTSMLESHGVQVQVVNWGQGARDLVGAWQFWRNLRGEKFAIVHQHWGGRAPRWLARRLGHAKVITHIHGHFIESQGLTPIALQVQGADLVIATSRAVADCVVGARARVVYPGVEVPDNHCQPPAPLRTPGEIVLGTAARLVPLKGIAYLIRALALLHKDIPGVRLEIAGSGPDRPALEQEVEMRGLGKQVKFLGWQSEVAPIMTNWDVYVQPSIGEPFGIAALEAMAAGLPVVATNAGGLPELVLEGETGWVVPPGDPAALADRIRALLVDPEERRRMGEAGRARARVSFSADRMVGDVSAIYHEALTGREAS